MKTTATDTIHIFSTAVLIVFRIHYSDVAYKVAVLFFVISLKSVLMIIIINNNLATKGSIVNFLLSSKATCRVGFVGFYYWLMYMNNYNMPTTSQIHWQCYVIIFVIYTCVNSLWLPFWWLWLYSYLSWIIHL